MIGGGLAMLAPTIGSVRRRLDHRNVVLALAVPDQRRAGIFGGGGWSRRLWRVDEPNLGVSRAHWTYGD